MQNAVFRANHHFSVNNLFVAYIGIICVDINAGAVIVPPSTLPMSCTIITAPIIIVIWSRKFHPIQWVIGKLISMGSMSSTIPCNTKWVSFTGTSYTELSVVDITPATIFWFIIYFHLPWVALCKAMD